MALIDLGFFFAFFRISKLRKYLDLLSEIWSPAYGSHEGGEPVHAVHQVVGPQSGLRPQERRVEESHASGPALHSDNSGQILVLPYKIKDC